MLFNITIFTKLNVVNISSVKNKLTFVVVVEFFNIKIIINKFANTTKLTIVKFLITLIQFLKLEIVR